MLRRAAAAGDAHFELCAARPLGTWRPPGEIVLGAALPDDDAEALTFDPPVNTVGGLEITPLLLHARHVASRASQARRPGARPPDSAA